MIGEVIGSWTVLAYGDRLSVVLCRCACGNEREVKKWKLKSGLSRSCGCSKIDNKVGRTYGSLTVVEMCPHVPGERGTYWMCRCACGNVIRVLGHHLRVGDKTSCAPCRRAFLGQRARGVLSQLNTKHGMAGTPEYRSWTAMLARCYSDKSANYKYYGGRGVAVCEAWRASFEQFLKDMGPRPSLAHSLDRIDPNGDYRPGNVRWATAHVQANNKRRHHAPSPLRDQWK